MLQEIVKSSLPGLEALFVAIMSLFLVKTTQFVNAHITNTKVNGILQRLLTTVAAVVTEAEQTAVSDLKGAPIDAETGRKIRDDVLTKLKAHLGDEGLREIKDILRPDDLNAMLISFIETKVNDVKLSRPPAYNTIKG